MAKQLTVTTTNEALPLTIEVTPATEVPPPVEEPSRRSIKEFISEVTSGNRRSSRQVRDSLWMAYMAAMESDDELTAFPEELAGGNREHYRSNRDRFVVLFENCLNIQKQMKYLCIL